MSIALHAYSRRPITQSATVGVFFQQKYEGGGSQMVLVGTGGGTSVQGQIPKTATWMGACLVFGLCRVRRRARDCPRSTLFSHLFCSSLARPLEDT